MARTSGRTTNISNQAGSIRSDELDGFKLQDLKNQLGAQSANPGGVYTQPVPWFGSGGVTYWSIVSVSDDDEAGLACFTQWRIPHETTKLEVHYRYVNKNGTWGRRQLKMHTRDITDTDRAAQFLEWEWTKLRPKKRIIIVKAIAFLGPKRQSHTAKNPAEGLIVCGTPQVRADGTNNPEYDSLHPTTPPGPPTPMGTDITNFVTGGYPPSSHELAQIWTGAYLAANVRITAVGSPKAEQDGVYWPVTVTFNADTCRSIGFNVARVGGRRASTGKIDLSLYHGQTGDEPAGSEDTDAKRIANTKPRIISRIPLTDAEIAAGTAILHVGPFNVHQAKRTWHVLRVRSRRSVDDDAIRQGKEHYPSSDSDLAATPVDGAPVNSLAPIPGRDPSAVVGSTNGPPIAPGSNPLGAAGGAMLAILRPQGPITDAPSDPSTDPAYLLRNEADDSTALAGDYVIELKAFVSVSDHTKTAGDTNCDELVFVIARKGDEADPTRYKRFRVEVDDADFFGTVQFHRKHHRRLVWVKNRAKNSIDKKDSTGAAVTFRVGSRRGDDENPEQMITNAAGANAIDCLDDWDNTDGNHHARVTLGWNNNVDTPATPRRVLIWRTKTNTNPGATKPEATTSGGNQIVPAGGKLFDDVTGPWKYVKTVLLKDEEEFAAGHAATSPAFFTRRVGVPQAKDNSSSAAITRFYLFQMAVVGSNKLVSSNVVDNIPNNDVSSGAPADTAVPGAPGNPTARFRHGHLRLHATRPTTQNATIFQREWEISTTAAFSGGSTWVVRSDSAPFSTTAPTVAANTAVLGSGMHISIPLRRKDFRDQSWTGNIYARCRDYNQFDPTTGGAWSNGGTGIAVLSVANFDGDAGTVPDALAAAPRFTKANIGQSGLHVKFEKPADGRNFIYYEFEFNANNTFSGVTQGMDPETGLAETTGTTHNYPHKFVSEIKLRDLAATFYSPTSESANPTLYVRARIVDRDADGAERAGTWSGANAVSKKHGGDDKYAAQHPRHYMHGDGNKVPNGDFLYDRSAMTGNNANTDLGRDARTQPGGGTRITSTATIGTDGILWSKTDHCVDIRASVAGTYTTKAISLKLPSGLVPGQTYSLTFLVKKDGASEACPGFSVELYDTNGGTYAQVTNVSLNETITTSYKMVHVVLLMDTANLLNTGSQWVVVGFMTNAESDTYHFDKFCLREGEQARPYSANPTDEIGPVTSLGVQNTIVPSGTIGSTGSDFGSKGGGGNGGAVAGLIDVE